MYHLAGRGGIFPDIKIILPKIVSKILLLKANQSIPKFYLLHPASAYRKPHRPAFVSLVQQATPTMSSSGPGSEYAHVIDWEEAMEQCGDDEDFLRELLSDLRGEVDAQVVKINEVLSVSAPFFSRELRSPDSRYCDWCH
jgi:hypothetical protein